MSSSITVRPTPDALLFSRTVAVPWSQTNLGAGTFRLREREEFYWAIEMTAYDRNTKTLYARVSDFEADPEDFQPDRPARAPVARIEFAPLERAAFCSQLSYYEAGRLPLTAVTDEQPTLPPVTIGGPVEAPNRVAGRSLRFTVPIDQLTFGDGYVAGTYASAELPDLPFRIPNAAIVKEFDAIRPYFARALRRTTAVVTAELRFDRGGEPRLARVASAEVARIDERLIEVLRARTLRQFIRQDDPDKRLFTPEDLWERSADDDPVHALLPPPGRELLEEILRDGSVRNARQLTYLVDRHERGQKLRFVLSPNFGFFFVIRGEGMHHFVLELLDSHATYVWSIPREAGTLTDHFALVRQEVEQLNATGRQAYRRANTFDYTFWSVRHEQVGSDFVDGFPRWRARLEEGLV
ncbi:hypothetical protein [Lewinella sp. IMCC34191]|uniref:hypothetical protein n=1 Tax=Lewinella sp. IMCC34191 TaxID=2259172 RepID=UPI000E288A89|nr:hypothetical protein [Lewinella sp. IMCC34191]